MVCALCGRTALYRSGSVGRGWVGACAAHRDILARATAMEVAQFDRDRTVSNCNDAHHKLRLGDHPRGYQMRHR